VSQAQYAIYRQKVLDLASTLVVKSKATAHAINQATQRAGFAFNDNDPRTWKYYQNLAGQYHLSDKPMQVKSLDTLQTIEFTRTNLLLHSATLREYQYGTEYYRTLVNQYPDQEMLILGILNPVEISVAMAAQDGDILFYNQALVEENETNLIPLLQDWTRNFMARWDVQAYSLVDLLYPAAQLWVMFTNIPNEIENIRFQNIHTIYAHSYHIREFLASQGRLDRYFDALNTEQRLWLYRNIRWIHRNVGKEETFKQLMYRLLTRRGFPLAEWGMEHGTAEMPDELYPNVEFVRKNLNIEVITAGRDTITIQQMLEKEAPLVKGNPDNIVEEVSVVQEEMENSLQNKLKTKALESSILDLTDAFPYTLSDFLLYHWAFLANRSRYNAVVTVDDPKTGNRLTLSVKDAFLAFLYSYNKARGQVLETLGEVNCLMIRRTPTPMFTELRPLVSKKISDDLLRRLYERIYTMPSQYISTAGFRDGITSVYNNLMRQRTLWAMQHDFRTRGELKVAALRFYGNYSVDLGGSKTYTTWLREQGLQLDTYSDEDLDLLASELLKAATGADQNTQLSLKQIQGSMLKLMGQLSSYSIQFLQTINDSPIKVVDWQQVSPTDPDVHADHHAQWPVVSVRGQRDWAIARRKDFVDTAEFGGNVSFHARGREEAKLIYNTYVREGSRPVIRQSLLLPRLHVFASELTNNQIEDVTDTQTEYYVPKDRLPLEDAFMSLRSEHYALTPDERQSLIDRWKRWEDDHPIELPDPDYTITQEHLGGYQYPTWLIEQDVLDGYHYPDMWDPGEIALGGPLLPEFDQPTEFDVALTAFPNFDGLVSPVGTFEPHVLELVTQLGKIDMPAVELLQRLQGHTPLTISLEPVMLGYMVMLGLENVLDGHVYTPPTQTLEPVMLGYMTMLGLKNILDGHNYVAPSDPDLPQP